MFVCGYVLCVVCACVYAAARLVHTRRSSISHLTHLHKHTQYTQRTHTHPTGRTAIVTGGRVKIGFEVGLRLLRCGCRYDYVHTHVRHVPTVHMHTQTRVVTLHTSHSCCSVRTHISPFAPYLGTLGYTCTFSQTHAIDTTDHADTQQGDCYNTISTQCDRTIFTNERF